MNVSPSLDISYKSLINYKKAMDYCLKNKLRLVLVLIAIIGSYALTSCGSLSGSSVRDFQEGFRQGWNATAPEEYRY